ncbi:retrovirus-related pol polyprotein from transposon TNT 1-94 [Tanacetum coccineum]
MVVDYNDEYQGELQGNSQEDNLTPAMMLLSRAISQKFSTPTNNRFGGNANKNTVRKIRNQVFNVGNGSDESNPSIQRISRTDSTPSKANVQCYNCNEKGHYARECQKPKVDDAKYFREQMLLAMKDEAENILINEENNFMLDNSYGEESLEELTAAIMLMARLQPAYDNTKNVPSYDAKAVSEVNASSMVYEQVIHVKRKTIIQTKDVDQIDYSIIFDDPFVENNGGMSEHDSNVHDEYPGLGYQNPKRLKKAIAAQPKLYNDDSKLYNGDSLHNVNLIIDSPDLEETLEEAEESDLK